ncbi:MAG: hypothetical protein AMJ63_08530 [Myxococcales bacterium SG8_38_1]|nr:MAG: hypothetical protein AMJ63_08530 [Myxococcales bacterium SG8_38_1]
MHPAAKILGRALVSLAQHGHLTATRLVEPHLDSKRGIVAADEPFDDAVGTEHGPCAQVDAEALGVGVVTDRPRADDPKPRHQAEIVLQDRAPNRGLADRLADQVRNTNPKDVLIGRVDVDD